MASAQQVTCPARPSARVPQLIGAWSFAPWGTGAIWHGNCILNFVFWVPSGAIGLGVRMGCAHRRIQRPRPVNAHGLWPRTINAPSR